MLVTPSIVTEIKVQVYPETLELEKKNSIDDPSLTTLAPDGEMVQDCPVVEAVMV